MTIKNNQILSHIVIPNPIGSYTIILFWYRCRIFQNLPDPMNFILLIYSQVRYLMWIPSEIPMKMPYWKKPIGIPDPMKSDLPNRYLMWNPNQRFPMKSQVRLLFQPTHPAEQNLRLLGRRLGIQDWRLQGVTDPESLFQWWLKGGLTVT